MMFGKYIKKEGGERFESKIARNIRDKKNS